MSELYLGIDCGGSKTAFALADAEGRLLAQCEKGPADTLRRHLGEVEGVILSGTAEVLKQAGVAPERVTRAGLGLSGFGETEEGSERLRQACERALCGIPFMLENDVVIAWAGVLSMRPGIVVIAGTGANCYGRNAAGEGARASGWGAYCDEGSGQWFGAKIAQLFTRQADGRMPKTALYALVREAFRLDDDLHFAHPLNSVLAESSGEMAKLFPIALNARNMGDPHATQLFDEAAEELSLAVRTVAGKIGFVDGGYEVSYAGGVFNAGDAILSPLRKALEGHATLIAPERSPVLGAALLAQRV